MTRYALHHRKPDELAAALLQHLERMRLTIPWVVRRFYFPAHAYPDRIEALKLAGAALQQLAKRKKAIEAECPGRTRPKYYLVSGSRQGEAAIGYDLATLWATCVRPVPRYRISNEELRTLLDPCPYKNIRHIMEETSDIEGTRPTGIIYRVYPTTAELKEAVRSLKKTIKDATKKSRALVESGDYGFLVLAETKAKAKAIDREVRRPDERGHAISHTARIVVEYAPRPESLAKALKELPL